MPEFGRLIHKGDFFLIKIGEKDYKGIVQEISGEKGIKIKVTKPDQTLVHLMPDSEIDAKFIADDGMLYQYTTFIVERKIPTLTFQFPPNNLEGTSVRKHVRVPTSFWTAILKIPTAAGQALEPIGDGTVVDMAVGGARVMTHVDMKPNEPILFEFEPGEGGEAILCKGLIKSVKPARYGAQYFGIQFQGMSEETLNRISKILSNPTV
jgi:hypothetical protein